MGKFGGSLAGVPAFALGATVIKQLLEAPEKPWTESDGNSTGFPMFSPFRNPGGGCKPPPHCWVDFKSAPNGGGMLERCETLGELFRGRGG